MQQNLVPVILCGGSGTRLWPLSREMYPKQFVDLGAGRTLFGDTVDRALQVPGCGSPVVICNEEHRFYAAGDLQRRKVQAQILLEPEGRNTAPAIALAALALCEGGKDALMLVLPSDHVLENGPAFQTSVAKAAELAAQGYIVTFGIKPTGPETGFGYIQQGEALGSGGFAVARFVEKPKRQDADAMLTSGNFYWNSGMFLMRASTYLVELQHFAPEIHASCEAAWRMRKTDSDFVRPGKAAFLACPSDSIDYAVMEHSKKSAVMPLDVFWSDLGSWEAFYQTGQQDENHNVCSGDVLIEDVENCYLHARHRLLAAIGLHDVAVVETQDAVLVAPRDQLQQVKRVVARLRRNNRPEYRLHPLVYRPWGSYETLIMADRFQVKRIVVNPGAELSLQMHHHRAEHWVVVSGTAEVTKDGEKRLFTENQSTYIPVGASHRLKNPGVIPLVLIEIQSGAYLGEDDIVRFADAYGRETTEQKGSLQCGRED